MKPVEGVRVRADLRFDGVHAQDRGLAGTTARPPQALPQRGHRPRRADLPDARHLADVDPEFQGGGADRGDRQPAPAQPFLHEGAVFPRQAGVVRKELLRQVAGVADPAQQVGEELDILAAARIDEVVPSAQMLEEVLRHRPARAALRDLLFFGRGGIGPVPGSGGEVRAQLDAQLRPVGAAPQQPHPVRRLAPQVGAGELQVTERGRQPDPANATTDRDLDPGQQGLQVHPALGVEQGVELVHDDGLGTGEQPSDLRAAPDEHRLE